MQVAIQAVHFNAKASLQEFVKQQVSKLSRFHNRIVSADVYLRLEKDDEKENKLVEISLKVPGRMLFASEQSHSFEAAARLTTSALERQLERFKSK